MIFLMEKGGFHVSDRLIYNLHHINLLNLDIKLIYCFFAVIGLTSLLRRRVVGPRPVHYFPRIRSNRACAGLRGPPPGPVEGDF